jgi:hypothetical protein
MIALVLAILAPTSAYKLSAQAGVTPVQKVLQMMEEMKAKGEAEKAKEAALFESYASWCDKMKYEKEKAIKEESDIIAKIHAHRLKMHSDAATLGDQVVELEDEATDLTHDKSESTEVRTDEHDDYEHVHEDANANIDALGDAMKQLEAKAQDAGPAFVQISEKKIPQSRAAMITALLAEAQGQPAQAKVDAYQSSSGGILETLGGLETDLGEDRETMETEESSEVHSYHMEQDTLETTIEKDEDRAETKTVTKAQKREKEEEDAAAEAAATKQRDEDEKYLAELVAQCEQKSSDFEARSKMRAEELVAIQQAIDIIASKSVAGSADKHLPALVQRAFALRASATTAAAVKARQQVSVARFLQKVAQKLHSKTLAHAATAVRDGPFDKVTQMIKDMITKLTEQAGDEAEHKEYCDKELNDNKNTRDSKTAEVESLTGAKDKTEAEISSLKEQCAELSKAIADLDEAMSEATAQRQKEHAQNTEAISDAKEAISAVKSALSVLEEFYAKAATATALVQGPADDAPESFSTPYKGMGGSGKGVIGMLEVILSDFVRLEQETSSEEAEASAAFEEFSATSTEDKETKTGSLQDKEKTIIKKTHSLQQTKKDLETTQTELNAAMEYYDKLKPACLDAGVDYNERVARREEEIASLTDALKILGEDA